MSAERDTARLTLNVHGDIYVLAENRWVYLLRQRAEVETIACVYPLEVKNSRYLD